MVATRPTFRWPELQFDRATAFGLALAGNAALFLMLSLPYDSGGTWVRPAPPPDPPIVVSIVEPEIITQPQAVPLLQTPVRPDPTPVLRPIVENPTSQVVEVVLNPPGEHIAVDSLPNLPMTVPQGPPRERRAGVAYGENPAPDYPRIALRQGLEGTVVLRVLVSATGNVRSLEIESSSGHRELDRAAERQVMNQWKFIPALRDGHAVEAWVLVPVNFSLRRR